MREALVRALAQALVLVLLQIRVDGIDDRVAVVDADIVVDAGDVDAGGGDVDAVVGQHRKDVEMMRGDREDIGAGGSCDDLVAAVH